MENFHEAWNRKVNGLTSHILAWITLLSEWELVKLTKPCNLAQTILIQLMNKSYERFILSKCEENAPIDQKGYFELYRNVALTKMKL